VFRVIPADWWDFIAENTIRVLVAMPGISINLSEIGVYHVFFRKDVTTTLSCIFVIM